MEQAHLTVSGFVQGVGYRQFVKTQATKLGIHGFVKNLPNGTVEVLAQGSKITLQAFIKQCDIGSAAARVETIDITWNSVLHPFTTFTVFK